VIALGFALQPKWALTAGAHELAADFDDATGAIFSPGWRAWGATAQPSLARTRRSRRCCELSAAILKIHEDRAYPGPQWWRGLSVPWGGNRTDSLVGYHLLWPRDCDDTHGDWHAGANQRLDASVTYSRILIRRRSGGRGTLPKELFPRAVRPYWSGIQLDLKSCPARACSLASWARSAQWRCKGRLRPLDGARGDGFIAPPDPPVPRTAGEENPGVSPFTWPWQLRLGGRKPLARPARRRTRSGSRTRLDTKRLESWCYVRGYNASPARVRGRGY